MVVCLKQLFAWIKPMAELIALSRKQPMEPTIVINVQTVYRTKWMRKVEQLFGRDEEEQGA